MKKILYTLIIISLFTVSAVAQQGNKQNGKAIGTWKFDATYAPEGYQSGTIVVGVEEKKPVATMSFTGNEYKIPGEKVKTDNDSVNFSIYLEGQDIRVLLKVENETKMSGKAVYSEGEVPLVLTKVVATEPEVRK
jgi:hypothetical protein